MTIGDLGGVTVRALTVADLEAALDGVAALRIAVFRDWPYLYDGSLDYERQYLQTYRDSPGALLVGAFHGDRLVGASTSTPMEDHAEAFAGPLKQIGDYPLVVALHTDVTASITVSVLGDTTGG